MLPLSIYSAYASKLLPLSRWIVPPLSPTYTVSDLLPVNVYERVELSNGRTEISADADITTDFLPGVELCCITMLAGDGVPVNVFALLAVVPDVASVVLPVLAALSTAATEMLTVALVP